MDHYLQLISILKDTTMKTLLIAASLILPLSTVSANSKWAQGPFWMAPQESEFTRGLTLVESELIKSCESYKTIYETYKNDPADERLAEKIERFRKMALPLPMQNSFKARFAINDVDFNSMSIEGFTDKEGIVSDTEKAPLPYFYQLKSFTTVNLGDASEFAIEVTSDSFVNFSRKLLLEDAGLNLKKDRIGKVVLEVEGRDLACDLLQGRAQVMTKLPSVVQLPTDASKFLETFYNGKLAPIIDKTLSASDSLTQKALKLGYRLGVQLDESVDGNSTEKYLLNLVNLLFKPKSLDLSEHMSVVQNKKVILFSSRVEGQPVLLKLGGINEK